MEKNNKIECMSEMRIIEYIYAYDQKKRNILGESIFNYFIYLIFNEERKKREVRQTSI